MTNSLELFGTFGLSYVITLQRQLPAHDFDEVLRKQSCTRGQMLKTPARPFGNGQKQLLSKTGKLSHNVTFGQHVAQTQSSHDIIHVTVDTLGHSGILKQEIKWCGFI